MSSGLKRSRDDEVPSEKHMESQKYNRFQLNSLSIQFLHCAISMLSNNFICMVLGNNVWLKKSRRSQPLTRKVCTYIIFIETLNA